MKPIGTILRNIGLGLGISSFGAWLYTKTFNWCPAEMPLDISTDNTCRVTFTASMNADHYVLLYFERTLPTEELDALQIAIDEQSAIDNPLPHIFANRKLPRATCTIFQDGQKLFLNGYKGVSYGPDGVGVIPAFAGHAYTVEITVKGGETHFQTTNPSVIVQVYRRPFLFGGDNILWLEFVIKWGIALGVGFVVLGALISRKCRPHTF